MHIFLKKHKITNKNCRSTETIKKEFHDFEHVARLDKNDSLKL